MFRGLIVGSVLLAGPAMANDADVGRAVYQAKCAACHGKTGKGDGPAARALPKKPADLSAAAYWTDKSTEGISATITKGKPGTAMRGFPMSEDKLSALVGYLRSLPDAE